MSITNLFFKIYRNLIFKLPPEVAHSLSLNIAEYLYKSFLKKMHGTANFQKGGIVEGGGTFFVCGEGGGNSKS